MGQSSAEAPLMRAVARPALGCPGEGSPAWHLGTECLSLLLPGMLTANYKETNRGPRISNCSQFYYECADLVL